MTTATLSSGARMVHIDWGDGTDSRYPYIWLRDNDPSGFHPQTKERAFDLTSIPLDITASDVRLDDNKMTVRWQADDHVTVFDLAWLHAHQPGKLADDPATTTAQQVWRADLGASGIPRANWAEVMESDNSLRDWMTQTRRFGLAIVQGIPDSTEAGVKVAERIGFLRRTNFGTVFEVESKPDPNNLAYTSVALPLHTDLPNQEIAPGFQFLHCLANEATGGGSMFCDGFAIAEELRKTDPAAFDLLASTSVPFRFHDTDCDIRTRKRVIETDENGTVFEICFNAHIADVLDIAPEKMDAYYRAYRTFMQMSRDAAFEVTLKLQAGEMVVFDNRRVLHGRQAFDPSTGYRHLHGCYVDRGEFDSRLRILAR